MSETTAEKRRLIKDPVWGNLEIFSWESKLLNHFLFNRLHNIVQNSSAFKVYPGLKYSRFLHTVGVSHVATQLFLSAAAKADGEAQAALLAEAEVVGASIPHEAKERIVQSIIRSYPCSPAYAVMLAAIRIAALIHDIGHLPFSHVFENAMDGFRQGKFSDSIKLTSTGQKRRDELNRLLAPHEEAAGPDVKLHELLGKVFVEVLQTSFHNVPELLDLLKVASQILQTSRMPIAKGFIIGTIDADRLDFVRRDGFFSGLFNSSVDYGRIFAFYELAKDEASGVWKPRPSPRTVSETEKLLLERFLDYKYIVVHHRVHLYDEIMENILVRLMANGTLDSFVETLCWLLKFDQTAERLIDQLDRITHLKSLLTEFDDPWVEIEIRRQYSKLDKSHDGTTRMLFEAYVEDRHSFRSAFKTDEEFQQACKKYAPALAKCEPNVVRNAFGASKYLLQKELSDKLQRTVLIGATDKKLSYGIRNEGAAKFLNVSDLYDFLIQKKIHSLTFNFWYEDSSGTKAQHDKVVATALQHLQEVVTKQLQLAISEPLAKKK